MATQAEDAVMTTEVENKGPDVESPGRLKTTDAHQQEETGKWVRMRKVLRKIFTWLKSLIGLVFLLILYWLLGAAIFEGIEGAYEDKMASEQTSASNQENLKDILAWLTNVTEQFRLGRIDKKLWQDECTSRLNVYSLDRIQSSAPLKQWTFAGAMFYCTTIFTTIGYGNMYPRTDLGRFITMVYAVIGIPLALLTLAELGKKLTVGLKILWAHVRRFYYTGQCRKLARRIPVLGKHIKEGKVRESPPIVMHSPQKKGSVEIVIQDAHEQRQGSCTPSSGSSKDDVIVLYGVPIDEQFNLPPAVATVILLLYISLGAVMYALWERNWSLLDSFYFVFISISTIGFGDVLPEHPKYFLVSSIYMLLGLSLVSMCINVAIEFFTVTIDKTKTRMNQAKDRVTELGRHRIEDVNRHIHKAKDKMHRSVTEVKDKLTDEVRDKMESLHKKKKYSLEKDDKINVEPPPRPESMPDMKLNDTKNTSL